jgi:predicted  nucleic acid-binding Zn-ribbon protein
MEQQITLLARLSYIDAHLDELHDELGDLPQEVKRHEEIVKAKTLVAEATAKSLHEIEHLHGTAHVTMQEMTDKETKLTEQQFQVKNNREFDAITKELEHIKVERAALDERLRTSAVKEENLRSLLETQQRDLDEAKSVLTDKEKELEEVSGVNNDDLRRYLELRKKVIAQVEDSLQTEYERIRTFHREAVVALRRNSCSGCYSAIPSQRIMEMKYNRHKVYTCENCGRILVTEDVTLDIEAEVEGTA